MSQLTVRKLAELINKPIADVIERFASAGLAAKSADDIVTDKEKMQLLIYLRKGDSSSKLVVRQKPIEQRQIKSKAPGAHGTVNVEIRKRRVYLKKRVEKPEKKPEEKNAEKNAVDTEFNAELGGKKQEVTQAQEIKEKKKSKEPAKESPAKEPQTTKTKSTKIASTESATTSQKATQTKPVAKSKKTQVSSDKKSEKTKVSKAGEKSISRSGEDRKHRQKLRLMQEKRGKRKLTKKKTRSKSVTKPEEYKHQFEKPSKPVKREIEVHDSMTVKHLAQQMAVKGAELIKIMMEMGVMATINQVLDQDTVILIVEEFGHTAKPVKDQGIEDILFPYKQNEGKTEPRIPIVTVMGHVDHGKTSLLDYIRQSSVASNEIGGITQHIGAYKVSTDKGGITFLDTPGHAAFTAMRTRGAKCTDIIVLVIAADDGVKPQTKEAIEHAKLAKVPLIIAMNKIDKPEADVAKVTGDLSQLGVVSEDWGGDTMFVEISAKTGKGIDNLLEMLLLQAEVMELKAIPEGLASGAIIESALDKGRGPTASVLIQQGCLRKGDILVVGKEYGRVRMLFDENGKKLSIAGPSTPVLVLGLSGVPEAGEEAIVVKDESTAKEIADIYRQRAMMIQTRDRRSVISAESFLSSQADVEITSLRIILKADVHGSTEALKETLLALPNEEIQVEIISFGVGAITESDISLAAAAEAIIVGFNVRADARARKIAQNSKHVDIRYYSIIYDVIDDVKQMMTGMLPLEIKEKIIGIAEVKDIFRSSRFGSVAGCQVMEGKVGRGNSIRVLRDNVVVFEGVLESLRRFKEEVNEVISGTECGIAVKNYNDIKIGDNIEVYTQVEIKRTI